MHVNQNIGKIGEDLAANFLIEKGYQIIERNYRFSHGEIDIVAKQNETLVFVEVKTRNNLEYGEPEYAITKNKQRQVRKMAELYLYDKDISDTDCRIDVITILLKKKTEYKINHIENAF